MPKPVRAVNLCAQLVLQLGLSGAHDSSSLKDEVETVDFLLRARRDVAAAKGFLRRAFRGQDRLPHKITLDRYQASLVRPRGSR
jgi:hypothetical protein